MRVLAAMSGGVDSSVAAARALAEGHEVVGVHLALSKDPQSVRAGSRGCCSLEDSGDARRVCDELGIPFYVWDFSERFKEEVVDDFFASYERGETPNPCLRCNERIKFAALLERGVALGFDAVVTGHYALLSDGILRRGRDPQKDQSYVLGVLDREQLRRSMFPVGDTEKPQIRQEARDMGLGTANKPDSYDICFIPDGNTQAFLGKKIGRRPGMVVDKTTGEKVAEHDGVYGFTIGQRKGLGLPGPMRDGKPRYVTGIDANTGTVTIGSSADLAVDILDADRAIWLFSPEMVVSGPVQVQVRAHGKAVDCEVEVIEGPSDEATGRGGAFRLHLKSPIRGVAPGQAAVLYRPDANGDYVLGSATITATGSSAETTSRAAAVMQSDSQ